MPPFAATAVPPPPAEESLPPQASRADELRRVRLLLTILAALAVIAALHVARSLLIPIALSLFFAALLAPVVNRLRTWGVPRTLGAALVLLVMLGTVVAVVQTTMDHPQPVVHAQPRAECGGAPAAQARADSRAGLTGVTRCTPVILYGGHSQLQAAVS